MALMTACGGAQGAVGSPCGMGLSPVACGVFGSAVVPRQAGSFGTSDLADVVSHDVPGGRAVRVRYPKGSASQASRRNHGSPSGGAQIYLPLKQGKVDALWLSYHVRFDQGFTFVKGGKLPGLYGGTQTSGGKIPDGTNGLSTRLMWRTGGKGEVYAYLPSSVSYGTQFGLGNWTFAVGRWTTIEQYVRLNHPGSSDGEIVVYVDGKEVLDQQKLVFRTSSDLMIEGVFFSTFFGGDDPTWAPPKTQYAEFAAFKVGSTRSAVQ